MKPVTHITDKGDISWSPFSSIHTRTEEGQEKTAVQYILWGYKLGDPAE